MLSDYNTARIIQAIWIVWALCWLAAGWRNKKPRVREPIKNRLPYQLVITLGALLMFIGLPDIADADADLFPRGPVLNAICIALVTLGICWALYARQHLGRNWSGVVQLKQDHSLIRSGPYRYSRHPIYTGLLLAFIGLGAFLDRWLELPGIALLVIGFRMKIAREERLMDAEFGATYADYRKSVRMLVPFVW